MKVKIIISILLLVLSFETSQAQVGIGTTTPAPSSELDVNSTTKGVLIPRMTLAQRNAISLPITSLLIYQVDFRKGFYYFDGIDWVLLTDSSYNKIDNLADGKSDNDGTDNGSSVFLGEGSGQSDDSSNNQNVGVGKGSLYSNVNGYFNTSIGYESLNANDNGSFNSAFGHHSLYHNISGVGNTSIGDGAMTENTVGGSNVAIGSSSLFSNTEGTINTAIGYKSMYDNIDGYGNTATGGYALKSNISGKENIAIGNYSLNSNIAGNKAVAIGYSAMKYSNNDTLEFANCNTAVGYESLKGSTTASDNDGNDNTAVGYKTLHNNISGDWNTATGYKSLSNNSTGSRNTAIGFSALENNSSGQANTAVGVRAGANNHNGSNNVFLGNRAGYTATGSNKLYIESYNADENNALIYGDFGTDITSAGNILRTNSQFQIGNPALTGMDRGYAFPLADGDTNQVLVTDGSGALNWTNADKSINDLIDAKSDNDGIDDGSSIFLGVDAGTLDDGSNNQNVGIGFSSLKSNTLGYKNVAIGNSSLFSNGTGYGNIAMGYQALYENINGHYNVAIGTKTMKNNEGGLYNTAMGSSSLSQNINGEYNTAYGFKVLGTNIVGSGNTAIGSNAGFNTKGDHNVFIGREAGFFEIGSNKLYINNSNDTYEGSLIYGEFDNKILRVNAELQVFKNSGGSAGHIELTETESSDGARIMFQNSIETDNKWTLWGRADDTPIDGAFNIHYSSVGNIVTILGSGQVGIRDEFPTYALELPNNTAISMGKARANAWFTYSDSRIKDNKRPIKYGLRDLMKISPKSYTQYNSSFIDEHLILDNKSGSEEIGFIAQELYKIIPEAVSKPIDESTDLWSIDYEKLIPLTVQSIQELTTKISDLESENKMLRDRLDKIETLLNK